MENISTGDSTSQPDAASGDSRRPWTAPGLTAVEIEAKTNKVFFASETSSSSSSFGPS